MPFKQDSDFLNLADWISCTTSEGPGKRFAIWVQGCSLQCVDCCNPEMFRFRLNKPHCIDDVFEWIVKASLDFSIEGVTFLGGEPFDQSFALAELAKKIQGKGLSVMIFSGYTLSELLDKHEKNVHSLLNHCDILVDGRYERSLHTTERRWIGSTNQQIHFLSDRYDVNHECWKRPNTVEITFTGNELQISGFPMLRRYLLEWKKRFQKKEEKGLCRKDINTEST